MAKSSFEKDQERLEAIVEALEEGGQSLDESIKKFEEGIKLAQRCEKALAAAEKKVEILTRNASGDLEAQPFGEEETGEARDSDKPSAPDESRDDEEESGGDEELLF